MSAMEVRVQVTRTSMVSGVIRTRELDITEEQQRAYVEGALVHEAFPHLSPEDREFFMTGITQEEWDAEFGGEDERR